MNSDGNARKLARICKVLSVDTRVRILQLITEQPLCVGALAARLGVTQGAVSQHLRILRDSGLVKADRCGYFVHYQLDEDAVAKWKQAIGAFLESGEASIICSPEGEGGVPCVTQTGNARNPIS